MVVVVINENMLRKNLSQQLKLTGRMCSLGSIPCKNPTKMKIKRSFQTTKTDKQKEKH
jgi:hypothetical protein